MQKLEPLYIAGGNVKWCSCFVRQSDSSLKVKHRVTIGSSGSTPRCILKKNENICPRKNLYLNIQSSIIHNSPKVETTQMSSTDDWINKMYNHTWNIIRMKINEVMIHATTWMTLENLMLSERSHLQKTTYCMIPFIFTIGKSINRK